MSAGDFSAFAFQVKQITLKMNRLQAIDTATIDALKVALKMARETSLAGTDPFD